MPIELSSLPTPAIIETLNFEETLEALMSDVTVRFTAAGVDYDVGDLETDPVKIILEAAAYREVLLRARLNDVVKSNLLPHAAGADLDNLAAFYGVTRIGATEDVPAEADAALRLRVVLAIAGRSTAGSEDWYAFHAMSADARIKEVKVYRVNDGPTVGVSVLSSENGGVPDQDMLDAVETAVSDRAVRAVSDVVAVAPATQQIENVAAQIWLLPEAPYSVFEDLADVLQAAWDAESGIGFDLNVSWLVAKLHVAGVARVAVTLPTASVVADDVSAIALGTIALTDMGRLR